jgi:chromosome segregation ATPase
MTKVLFVLTALVLSLSSCVVSKKKYDALLLENSKLEKNLDKKTAESQKLQVNLENAISDYESMKDDFGKSNALKTDEISDLMIMVTQLKDESEELSSKLDETMKNFKAKEADSYLANEELTQTMRTVNTLQRDTASLNYSLQLAKQRNKMLQEELKQSQEKASASGLKRVEIQKQLDAQSVQLKDMERQLVKSQQNMSEVSKAFIELRKEMLKAKSSNKPIDPNKSKQVDKVAKLLGHY